MSESVTVRRERPIDEDAIRAITDAAFAPSEDESRIVDALRAAGDAIPVLSLVAATADGTVVGHCVTSRGALVLNGGGEREVLILGPISVAPDRQRQGIGAALMRETIAIAAAEEWPLIVLLGHPAWYPRFGFRPARSVGIEPPMPWSDQAWMVLPLRSWTSALRGTVRFPPAFGVG